MAHPKAVPLELNGETHYLVYDFTALCALREVGVDAFDLTDQKLTDPRVIRSLVTAGLQCEHPGVTEAQVGKWIDLSEIAAVASAFTQAFERSTKRELADPQ